MGNLRDNFRKPEMDLKVFVNDGTEESVENLQLPDVEAEKVESKKIIKYDNLNSRVERDIKEWLDKYVRDIKDVQGKKVVKQEDLVQIALEILKYQNIDPVEVINLDSLKNILKEKNLLEN
jgi:hypothetical protein